jgi:glycosyltransferase involved in cell wall biosynthesis
MSNGIGVSKIELRLCGHSVQAVRKRTRFFALLPLSHETPVGQHELTVCVSLRHGTTRTVAAGLLEVLVDSRPALDVPLPEGPLDQAMIAICMATHEPHPALLERQVASIKEQSHQRFICIVSDDGSSDAAWAHIRAATAEDERFVCLRHDARVGFYRNFERCLELVPPEASFVALADQDDVWHPDKLATLTAALATDQSYLAYSDMNIVTASADPISPSYWGGRSNNFTDLGALLLMNTVTGASTLFRRELLDDALPFPPEIGRPFHDHWLACVALARGNIAYVDRPLYDYVQHSQNTVGSFTPSSDVRGGAARAIGRLARTPRARLRSTLRHAGTTYQEDLVRLEAFGQTLELRLGSRFAHDRASAVRRAARAGTSSESFFWLVGRSLRETFGSSVTLGVENQLLKAIAWRWLS